MRRAILLSSLALCGAVALHAAHAAEPELGAPMHAVRLAPDEHVHLADGIAHPAWQRVPVHRDFVEKVPVEGGAPAQATAVQVLFDDRALWVRVRADDSDPAAIRAPLVRADQVNRTQDFVVVYIDAIGSRRAAQFFRINAAGSMADGLHTAADDNEDFAPDFDWDGVVARDAGGWTALLRLPFASLRYADDAAAHWRIMVARRLPREQFHLFTSVRIPREVPAFISTLQPLLGVHQPGSHGLLTVRPSLTLRRDADGRGAADASLDLKWRPRAELVVDATLNPDFSQVALDVPQLAGNERFALQLAEKRPFFYESADLLRSPTEALYTRSLTQPRWGARATWRGANVAGSAFVIDDRGGGLVLLPGPYATGVAEQPGSVALAGRGRLDGGRWQGGLLAGLRRYADDRGANHVIGPDLNLQLDERWRVRAQWLHSHTTAHPDALGQLVRGPARDGDRAVAQLLHNGNLLEASAGLDESSRDFRHDTGFVGQVGVRRVTARLAKGWDRVGPLNEFWLNLEGADVREREGGAITEQWLRPGLWLGGPHNLEVWFEWHDRSRLRLQRGGELLEQRYGHGGIVVTPAAWWPFLTLEGSAGRMVDNGAAIVRDGQRLDLSATLRPLSALELETGLWQIRFGGENLEPYRERALQVLAVWHLDARNHLRLIAQRYTAERGAARDGDSRVWSLTYTHRRSAGTVAYVGLTRARDGGVPAQTEAFVKLQFDVDEARQLF